VGGGDGHIDCLAAFAQSGKAASVGGKRVRRMNDR
jgi:hypothetical protein